MQARQDLEVLVRQYMDITGAQEQQARYYLLKAKWDLNDGINHFMNEQEAKAKFHEKKFGPVSSSVQRKNTDPMNVTAVRPQISQKLPEMFQPKPLDESPERPDAEVSSPIQPEVKKGNAFELLTQGVSNKQNMTELYKKLELDYAKPAQSTLRGYAYDERKAWAMMQEKFHPDRLVSYHPSTSASSNLPQLDVELSQPAIDNIEYELEALVAEAQLQQSLKELPPQHMGSVDLPKGLDIEFEAVEDPGRKRDKVVAPKLKEVQSLMFQPLKQNSGPRQSSLQFPSKPAKITLGDTEKMEQSQSSYMKEAPLFIGQLPSVFRFKRTPRANSLHVGDTFRGERGKVSYVADFGKNKLSKQDPRRFTIEIMEEGLILGQLDERASKWLVPLMEASIILVWIRFITIPDFSSPMSESEVFLELYLLPSALSKPVMGLPSKLEEEMLEKLAQIKYHLGKLLHSLTIFPENKDVVDLKRDIETKPLDEWPWDHLIQSVSKSARDSKDGIKDEASNMSIASVNMQEEAESASLDSVDPDHRIAKFLDKELDGSDLIQSSEEPSNFSKDLELMAHQKYALSWLKMREGVSASSSKEVGSSHDSGLHPMWCQLDISLSDTRNQSFLENYEQESSASVQGVYKIFFNPYSGQISHMAPSYSNDMKNFKGGILADEMGLGKTVMMIALLLSNRLLNSKVYVVPKSSISTLRGTPIDQIGDGMLKDLTKPQNFSKSMQNTKSHLIFLSVKHLKHCLGLGIVPGPILDTLIVVPTSLAYQWRDEIKKFSSEPIKVLVFSEEEKVQSDIDIRSYDVIIISFGKLSYDYRKQNSKIHAVYWHRIIIDEAHQIRNRKTWMSKAVCALAGDRRWALTGTPVQNSLEDLYSLVSFMNYTPWSEYNWWNQNINKGLADPDPAKKSRALDLLARIIKPVTLRRTKAQHRGMLGLSERTEKNVYIKLDTQEQQEYSRFFLKSKAKFQQFMKEGTLNKCFMHVWPMIMKLRQMCDHLLLTQGRINSAPTAVVIDQILNQIETRLGQRKLMETELVEEIEESNIAGPHHKKRGKIARADSVVFESKKYREWVTEFYYCESPADAAEPDNKRNAMDEERPITKSQNASRGTQPQSDIQYKASKFCPVCLAGCHEMEDPIITSCGHVGCLACYLNCISSQNTCPLCSFLLHKEDLIRLPINSESVVLKQLSTSEFKLSSKLKLLLENLKPILEDSKDKVIIFSHFIGFLDIIHLTLRQKGIDVLEFKGTMNNKKRAEIIEEFNKPDGPRILAISIKAGGVGLNLTVANWVFLMEPWWNPAFEQQALDRVYRIGQKKPVTILKFICSETIEERIKNIQLGKDILAQNTLQLTAGGQGGPGDPRKPTEGVKQNMENLKKLFV